MPTRVARRSEEPKQTELLTVASASMIEPLPDDVAALKTLVQAQRQAFEQMSQALHKAQLRATLAEQSDAQARQQIESLKEQFLLMRRRLFGVSSEQVSGQGHLFNEAEVLADEPEQPDEEENQDAGAPGKPAKRRGKRAPLPPELPRVDIVHELPESERLCPCGTPMVAIGQQISEQLDIVPMKIQVLRHIRTVYGCPNEDHAPLTAPMPAQPLPKSNASPNLLAMLLTVKYADGLPLARFEKVLDRHNAPIPRQTLARYVIGAAKLMQPLFNLAHDALFEGSVIHMDETGVQVLAEPGRAATTKSVMWVRTGGPPGKAVVIYDYETSHGGEVPPRLLAGYQGWLMTDGHASYNEVAATPGIEHQTCWAHARRHFVDVIKIQAKGKHKRGRADEAIDLIRVLYRIEREVQTLPTVEQRYAMRQAQSRPALDALKAWLDKHLPGVPPSGALGKAMAYMARFWPKLIRYVERGDTPIDNNRCENAIRPFVIGRRAWMFSATPAGARASALIYSLIETCKANGVEPYLWLTHVMRDLPAAQSIDAIEALLPWNFHHTIEP